LDTWTAGGGDEEDTFEDDEDDDDVSEGEQEDGDDDEIRGEMGEEVSSFDDVIVAVLVFTLIFVRWWCGRECSWCVIDIMLVGGGVITVVTSSWF
jgi:hypothetical protein